MAVFRNSKRWAAIGLLCVAASAAAYVIHFGGTTTGARGVITTAPPVDARGVTMPTKSVGGDIRKVSVSLHDTTYMIITSDPQYPWKPEYDGVKGDCGEEGACSRALIEAQYASINRFVRNKHVLGTFINGDLTAFGHGWQIGYMRTAIKSLRTPVYLGLGNHDYENNVNDCYENSCVRESVHWFREHMAAMPLDAFDVREDRYYNFPSNRTDIHGSLGWTKRFSDLTVIQVNNYPEYETYAQGWNFGSARREQIFINDGMRWLEGQLRRERAAGQAIIVMSHIGSGSAAFTALLNRYEVSALFAGHEHEWIGPEPFWNKGQVPVFFSGSAVHRSYLIAERNYNNPELKLWVVEDNNEYNRRLAATIPLKRTPRYIDSELKSWITIKDTAYLDGELRVRFNFTNRTRSERTEPSYVGDVDAFRIPAWANHMTVHLERRQGAPTNPWRTVHLGNESTQEFRCLRASLTAVTKC